MTIYHGSSLVVDKPNIKYSKRYLDFGRGFYLTIYEEQAKRWAIRKAKRKNAAPIVNIYHMIEASELLVDYKVLDFKNQDERWLDFICEGRSGIEPDDSFDIIIGHVADDDVFKTIDFYFRGIWEKEKVLQELRYFRLNNQICLKNQRTIENVISFIGAYEVYYEG